MARKRRSTQPPRPSSSGKRTLQEDIPYWIENEAQREFVRTTLKTRNGAHYQEMLNILSAARSVIGNIASQASTIKEAKENARKSIAKLMDTSEVNNKTIDTSVAISIILQQPENPVALSGHSLEDDLATRPTDPSPIKLAEEPVHLPILPQEPSSDPQVVTNKNNPETTPQAVVLPPKQPADTARIELPARNKYRLALLAVLVITGILARSRYINEPLSSTAVPTTRRMVDAGLPLAADAHAVTSTPEVSHPAPAPHPTEAPFAYHWHFARPKPPGYQYACIHGAVMSILITQFGQHLVHSTDMIGQRAEAALRAVRGANEHTRENEDLIAVDYRPAENVMIVAQVRKQGTRFRVMAIRSINTLTGQEKVPNGYQESEARTAILQQITTITF